VKGAQPLTSEQESGAAGTAGGSEMPKKCEQQRTQLIRAVESGDLDWVRRLLARGLPVDATEELGMTALMAACRFGQVEVARFLVAHGASIHAENCLGETPLSAAAWRGHVEVGRLLAERGARIDHQWHRGFTALMAAARSTHAGMVDLLLELGADASLENEDGETALTLALERQWYAARNASPEALPDVAPERRVVEMLRAAQPGSGQLVAEWHVRREAEERWWQRSFRRLYQILEEYDGEHLFDEVLAPRIEGARKTMSELGQYRRRNSAAHPYEPDPGGLLQLYALSRVNDYLLLGLQTGWGLDWDGPFLSDEYREYRGRGHNRALLGWQGPGLDRDQYVVFFRALGLETVEPPGFHPLFQEVVEVTEDPGCGERVEIERVFWPALMWGDLLISRSGVHVRCARHMMEKEVAERSVLHFTFWRRRREVFDLSVGWGGNSQWNTEARRDYVEGDTLHYNVDGSHYLGDTYEEQVGTALGELYEPDEEPLEMKIDLLRYRCRVGREMPSEPGYFDRYSEPYRPV
jgi:hypothetical protein